MSEMITGELDKITEKEHDRRVKEEEEHPEWTKDAPDERKVKAQARDQAKETIYNYLKLRGKKLFNHTGTLKKLENTFAEKGIRRKDAIQRMSGILNERFGFREKLSDVIAGQVYEKLKAEGVPLDHKKFRDSGDFVLGVVNMMPPKLLEDFHPDIKLWGDHIFLNQGYRPDPSKGALTTLKGRLTDNFHEESPWKDGLAPLLKDPDRMDRLMDMFVSKKFINWNSDEYDNAKEAFGRFAETRNALLAAMRDGRNVTPEQLKQMTESFHQSVNELGQRMSEYLTHLAREEGGTEIDRKTQSAGKARLASSQLVMLELKKFSQYVSQELQNTLNQHQISEQEKVRVTDYEKLYSMELSKMNKKGDSNRHRKAADRASDGLKKTQNPVMGGTINGDRGIPRPHVKT